MFLSKILSTQYKILRVHDSSRDSVLFQFARIVQRQTKYLEIVMSVKGGKINKKRGKGRGKEQRTERISSKTRKSVYNVFLSEMLYSQTELRHEKEK